MASTTVVCERSIEVSSSSARAFHSESATERANSQEASYSTSSSRRQQVQQQRWIQTTTLLPPSFAPMSASTSALATVDSEDDDEAAWAGIGNSCSQPFGPGFRRRRRRPLSTAATVASASPVAPSPFGSPLDGEATREWRRFVTELEERHVDRRRMCDVGAENGSDERSMPPALAEFRQALLEVSAIDCQLARNLHQLSAGLAQLRRAAAIAAQQRRRHLFRLGRSDSPFSDDGSNAGAEETTSSTESSPMTADAPSENGACGVEISVDYSGNSDKDCVG